MGSVVWQRCVGRLQEELSPQQFDTCIKPLQARHTDDKLELSAPNRYVRDQVKFILLQRIKELVGQQGTDDGVTLVEVELAARVPLRADGTGTSKADDRASNKAGNRTGNNKTGNRKKQKFRYFQKTRAGASILNERLTFETFVEGESNELAKAAALQAANEVGQSYNPLLVYGGVGLGKTHLMQAVGHRIQASFPRFNVIYIHSRDFVQDMVDALREGKMREFAQFYQSANALLIDDIQFFANKLRSQDEFFHVFNRLLEIGHQVVLTSDCYPKEINGLEERLKSRFVHGMTVEVKPPELETRVAILMRKAEAEEMHIHPDVAFFVAEHVRSNVRELEGSLRRVIANARFTRSMITIDLVKQTLGDLIAARNRQISIGNIRRKVAEYYNVRLSDILSERRHKRIVRSRHMAMFLARQLTNHSLPEIGDAFGGRDHTTVLHACRKIRGLMENGAAELRDDHEKLSRLLQS